MVVKIKLTLKPHKNYRKPRKNYDNLSKMYMWDYTKDA